MVGRSGRWALGLGFTTCVVACAAPWVIALGGGTLLLSSATMAVLGTAETVGLGVAALGLAAIGGAAWRRRTAATSSCGCESACSVKASNVELSCTLDRFGGIHRLAEFRDVFERAYLGSERAADAVRWRFRGAPGLLEELRALAAKEMKCCQFFAFDVRTVGDEIWWDTRTPDTAKPVAEEFFALPQRVTSTDSQGFIDRLGHTFRSIGGHFGPGQTEGRP